MMQGDHDPKYSRSHKAALSLAPLIGDPDWLVALSALRAIQRLEVNRLLWEALPKNSKGPRAADVNGPLPFKNIITLALVAMVERVDEHAELLHTAILETLDQICSKKDAQLLAHLMKGLIHAHSKVQETSLTAIKVIVNGKGIQHLLEARAKASSSSPHKLVAGAAGKKVEKKKTEEDTGKYGVVIEACINFITELTAKQRRCNQLQLEVFRRETMMLKAGSDKEALWAELQDLNHQVAAQQLSEDEKRILPGQLQSVMHCLCTVVPQGNEAAITSLVACLEDEAFEVRMCALNNIKMLAGAGNMFALGCLVQMLSHSNTTTRWAAGEGILLVGGKGNRQLLSWMLIAMDSKDIEDAFVRQAIIGATAGILLPKDFASVVTAIGSDADKAALESLVEEEKTLQGAYQAEEHARLKEKAVLLERRAEAERLRESIRVGKAELQSEEWVDRQPFWEVSNRRDYLDSCRLRLEALQKEMQGTSGVAWEALLAHSEKLKELAVKCMVMRVFYEKRRGIIPALLAKNIDGLEPYAGELSIGLSASLMNAGGVGKAKAAFGNKLAELKKSASKRFA